MTHAYSARGERALSKTQVKRLAELVRRGLNQFGDPDIRAPHRSEFLVEYNWTPHNFYELSVNIDIGTTVLNLFVPMMQAGPFLGPDTNMSDLADRICDQIDFLRSHKSALERLKSLENTANAKIKRDRLLLKNFSVRFEPVDILQSAPNVCRRLWSRVELLDDLLLPYSQLIQINSPRGLCRKLKHLGQEQEDRLKVRQRLAAQDAILEINASAEHAINASGQSVGQAINRMIKAGSSGNQLNLWTGQKRHTWANIYAHNGRIGFEASIPPLHWHRQWGVEVSRVFPAIITSALIGQPLCKLIEHPFLQGSTEITDAENDFGIQTIISVSDPVRAIKWEELIAAAP